MFLSKTRFYLLKGLPIIFIAFVWSSTYLIETGKLDTYHKGLTSLLLLAINFGSDILAWIKDFGPNKERAKYVNNKLSEFSKFLRKYFSSNSTGSLLLEEELPIGNHLSKLIENWGLQLGNSSENARRTQLILLTYMIKANLAGQLETTDYENPPSYIREIFKDLSDVGKKEFWSIYFRLIISEQQNLNSQDFFKAISGKEQEQAKKHFFSNYIPASAIDEITEQLKFEKSKAKAFKSSIASIAHSGKLSLSFLEKFVQGKKTHKKLFILASKSGLSKDVQLYIKQGVYFILNHTTIANLPGIGLSRGMDIFFFSPKKNFRSAEALYKFIKKIDPQIQAHPLKIYDIDPFSGFGSAYGNDIQFAQAISYFENTSFDPTSFEVTPQQQLNALMGKGVSLKEILQGLPASEFSTEIVPAEKQFFDTLTEPHIKVRRNVDIFALLKGRRVLEKAISKMHLADFKVKYSRPLENELFAGKLTLQKVRNRYKGLLREVCDNLEIVDEFLA